MVLVESSVSQKGAMCMGSHLVRFRHSFGMTGASLWQEIHSMADVLFTLYLVYRLGLCFTSIYLSQMFVSIFKCDMKSLAHRALLQLQTGFVWCTGIVF